MLLGSDPTSVSQCHSPYQPLFSPGCCFTPVLTQKNAQRQEFQIRSLFGDTSKHAWKEVGTWQCVPTLLNGWRRLFEQRLWTIMIFCCYLPSSNAPFFHKCYQVLFPCLLATGRSALGFCHHRLRGLMFSEGMDDKWVKHSPDPLTPSPSKTHG